MGRSTTRRDEDRGWSVELAIPWASWPSTPIAHAPPRRRPVAGQLLAGRVASPGRGRQYAKVPGLQGRQLGLVAPGRHRHAPPRALGLRPVLDRQAGFRGVPPRSQPPRSRPPDDDLPCPGCVPREHKAWASTLDALKLADLRLPGGERPRQSASTTRVMKRPSPAPTPAASPSPGPSARIRGSLVARALASGHGLRSFDGAVEGPSPSSECVCPARATNSG